MKFMSHPALLPLLLALALLGSSCRPRRSGPPASRATKGSKPLSASHGSCVSCHGGDPKAEAKEASHKSMLGGKNPSAPSAWEKGCGDCHRYQLERVKSGLMYTNAGMIRNIQLTWEGEDGQTYAAWDAETHDETGAPVRFKGVAGLENLSGELYRKFCSLCHLGLESAGSYAAGHASGCAACHFPFNDTGSYEGGDPTVTGKASFFREPRPRPPAGQQGVLPLPQPERQDRPFLRRAERRQQLARPHPRRGTGPRDDQRRQEPDPHRPGHPLREGDGLHRLPHLAGHHGGRVRLRQPVPAGRDRLRGLPRQRRLRSRVRGW